MSQQHMQEVSVRSFEKDGELYRVLLVFRGELANFPSVANSKRRLLRCGRVVWNRQLKKKLESYTQAIGLACVEQLGEIPKFTEKVCVIAGLSSVNKRKDIDNCFKGIVDYGLEKTGIVPNDNLVLILPVPFWWIGDEREISFLDIIRWRDIADEYTEFINGAGLPDVASSKTTDFRGSRKGDA